MILTHNFDGERKNSPELFGLCMLRELAGLLD